MHVVEWSKASRHIPQDEIDDFYHRPLKTPTAFRFTTSRLEMPLHSGAFSLKAVRAGEETYCIGRRSLRVRPGHLLFVNKDETYSSCISQKTTSLCLFTPQNEVGDAARAAREADETLLDDPFASAPTPEIAQIVFAADAPSLAALNELERALDEKDGVAALECMRALLAAAIGNLTQCAPRDALRNVRKRSTRDEILERVLRAKQIIDDTGGAVSDLEALAEAACLSKYHFLRVFAEVCGLPPGAYARRKRLETARHAMKRHGNVARAARQAGYRDIRAFERAMQRTFGAPAFERGKNSQS